MACNFNDFSKPKTTITLTNRWQSAKIMHDKSKSDPDLKAKILQHMNEEDYKAWDMIDVPNIIANYAQLTMRGKLGFLILWYFFNEKENIACGCLCPGSPYPVGAEPFT